MASGWLVVAARFTARLRCGYGPTATPNGMLWPVAIVWGLVPSRPAFTIAPLPELAQYRWPAEAPVPLSESVAEAAGLLLATDNIACPRPVLVGANCTTTWHDFPGPTLVALQVSLVMLNAPEPDSVTFNAEDADPPELVSVNVCEGV